MAVLLISKLLPASRVPAPVAHGLLRDPKAYIAGLNSYRAGGLDSWVAVFAAAISVGARAAARLSRQRARCPVTRTMDEHRGRVERVGVGCSCGLVYADLRGLWVLLAVKGS